MDATATATATVTAVSTIGGRVELAQPADALHQATSG